MKNILNLLDENFEEIRSEFLNYSRKTTNIVGLQDSETYGQNNIDGWSCIPLWWQYRPMKMFQKKFPITVELIKEGPCHAGTGFLVLDPGCSVPPHNHTKDIWKDKIICQLPLIIPKDGRCGMNVEGEGFDWEEGKIFAFDANKEHYTYNNSENKRVTLFFNFDKDYYDTIKKC